MQQEQAIYTILDGQTPLVIVLLISREKSLLFTMLAVLEAGRVTIVVVLYRALIKNLVQQI